MNRPLFVLVLLLAWPAGARKHSVFVALPIVHAAQYFGDHPEIEGTVIDRTNWLSPGLSFGYATRLDGWFEIGVMGDYVVTVHDNGFGPEEDPIHDLRFGIRVRLLRAFTDRVELSLASEFGLAVFALKGEGTLGYQALVMAGARVAIEGPWSLVIDLAGGIASANANRINGYTQAAATYGRLNFGLAWAW